MMDAPTSNQSRPPCQTWVVQNGWSTEAHQSPACSPLPSFHHLSLASSPDQTSCFNHLQASGSNSQSGVSNFERTVPDLPVPVPAGGGGNDPPSPLPLINSSGTSPSCGPQQISFYPTNGPYHAVTPPFQPPPTYQGLQNGPQSPHQSNLSINHVFDGTNVGPFGAYSDRRVSSNPPIQQQPQSTPLMHSRGISIHL